MTLSKIRITDLLNFMKAALLKADVPKDDANVIAETLMDCELRGYDDHGIYLFEYILNLCIQKKVNPRSEIKTLRESKSTILLDGESGLGVPIATKAMKHCINKAKNEGIASAGVCNAGYFVAASPYVMQAAKEGLIGFAMSNTVAVMPPPGGLTRIFGTNPFGYAIPTGNEYPILFDMATSVSAANKIFTAKEKGKKLKIGFVEDSFGNPITDPNDFDILTSLILPMAGAKGYGLALLIDILSGVLTYNKFGEDICLSKPDPSLGNFFIAMDIEKYMPIDIFYGKLEKLIEQIKNGKKRKGYNEIYLPGERGFLEKKEKLLKNYLQINYNLILKFNLFSKNMKINKLKIY